MDLSVVVPTLNGRDQLATSLDALAEHAPSAEVIVVNGPSADGTTGMVRDRDDVDVLIELSARSTTVARNAGLDAASGDVVAFLGHDRAIESTWLDAVTEGIAEADAVTGPTHRAVRAGMTTESPERRTILGREVAYFNGDNAAFRAAVLDDLDGFDEYLEVGSGRDAAHRLAGLDYEVAWQPEMSVRREYEADGGVATPDWGWEYRALAYRLVKNYGVRPTVAHRTLRDALSDGVDAAREVIRGDRPLTDWLRSGREVIGGAARGAAHGLLARARDRSSTRNPNGRSKQTDRAVARYDWRQ